MTERQRRVFLANRAALAGLGILVLFAIMAATVGLWGSYDPAAFSAGAPEHGPSASHWFGTDSNGRDVFTRIWYGGRHSLAIGVAAVVFSALFGIPLGAAAGYFGGWADMSISRLIDFMLSFPSILLAICIAAAMGAGTGTVVIAVGVVGVPQFARQVRASVLQIRELEYVLAARALGAGHARIILRTILPNATGPIIVLATLGIGTSILTAAGLSFLGLGVETGTPEWGEMLRDGYSFWTRSAWLALFSGMAISLSVFAFNLVGDGLADALDPRSRASRG